MNRYNGFKTFIGTMVALMEPVHHGGECVFQVAQVHDHVTKCSRSHWGKRPSILPVSLQRNMVLPSTKACTSLWPACGHDVLKSATIQRQKTESGIRMKEEGRRMKEAASGHGSSVVGSHAYLKNALGSTTPLTDARKRGSARISAAIWWRGGRWVQERM